MIGLSVWFFRDSSNFSKIDMIVKRIIKHNAKFFSKYVIVTNCPFAFEDKVDYPNVETFGVNKQKLFAENVLKTDYETIRDHQWSDIGTYFLKEICDADEAVLYVDSDFVISNGTLISELERYGNFYMNFYDNNFYLLGDNPEYYVNAAVSFYPKGPTINEYVRGVLMNETINLLSKHMANEYNSIGPRLINSYRGSIAVPENVLPNTPPFGEICFNDEQESELELKYTKDSLGIHLLFSMFRWQKLEPVSIRFKLNGIILSLKEQCC